MVDAEQILGLRHSFSTQQPVKHAAPPGKCSKSDFTFVRHKQLPRNLHTINSLNETLVEYYKRYEHDEVPVKDSSCHALTELEDRSLTHSELDNLKMNIFKNMSHSRLQANSNNNSSLTSMESNLKFFKTTVQEIFDNFYASMRDFELYKQRFHEILAKNEEEGVANMENFIKDVIHHIMSSESSLPNESDWSRDQSNTSKKTDDLSSSDMKDCDGYVRNTTYLSNPEDTNSTSVTSSIQPVIEAYTNEDYLTDTTIGDTKTSKGTSCKEVFNVYLLSADPYVQIKMNDRNRLSEINIKEPSNTIGDGKYVASAENMKRLADKKMELKKYVDGEENSCDGSDRDIPVKVSYAKKNIYLDEDFSQDRRSEKSFMSRICSYLCRKCRKY